MSELPSAASGPPVSDPTTPAPSVPEPTEAVVSLDPFVVRRRVLLGDCDPAGIVYTPRYAEYVMTATHQFLAHRLGGSAVRRLLGMGVLPVTRALSFEFLASLAWDDVVDQRVEVAHVGRRAFTLAVTGTNATGATAYTARLTMVSVSSTTRAAVELPLAFRAVLEPPRSTA